MHSRTFVLSWSTPFQRYTGDMTVKETLHQRIEEMSQEEAEIFLSWLEPSDWPDIEPLTPEQLARLDRALEQDRLGKVVPHEEVLRRLGRA